MEFGDFTITKREVIVSISIIVVMFLIGMFIHGKIQDDIAEKNEIYNKALKIESNQLFEYGMRTNVGYAFIYGELKAVDTVGFDEIDGEYMHVEKIEEHYNMHTRTVTKTRTVNGKTQTHTEVETYWSWDFAGRDSKTSSKLMFCDVEFESEKISIPGTKYIETQYKNPHVRYKYYGTGTEYSGTMFTSLKDDTISDGSVFYPDMAVQETVNHVTTHMGDKLFIVFWIIFTCCVVFVFVYYDNRWLD